MLALNDMSLSPSKITLIKVERQALFYMTQGHSNCYKLLAYWGEGWGLEVSIYAALQY